MRFTSLIVAARVATRGTLMTALADRTIAALRSNQDDLATRVRGFDIPDLHRPSGAAEWDVAQVLSHLGSGAEIGLAALRRGIAGEPAPDHDFNHSVWDRWNGMTAQQKADGFLVAGEELVAAYEALDASARDDLRVSLSFLPAPASVELLAAMRLNEAVMHSWDVRVAFDPGATLSDEEADVLLEQFTGPLAFLVGYLGRPAILDGSQVRLRVDSLTGEGNLGVLITDKVSLGEAPPEIDGVLTAAPEALLRLLAGRLSAEHTPTTVELRSDAVILAQLRDVFPGI